jgi:hypothetical protein
VDENVWWLDDARYDLYEQKLYDGYYVAAHKMLAQALEIDPYDDILLGMMVGLHRRWGMRPHTMLVALRKYIALGFARRSDWFTLVNLYRQIGEEKQADQVERQCMKLKMPE